MFHKAKFEDYVDGFWLEFKNKELEDKVLHAREEQSMQMNMFKLFVALFGSFMSILIIYMAFVYFSTGDHKNAWLMITCVIIGDVGIGFEFVVHKFDCMKYIRGYPVTIGLFVAAAYGSTDVLLTPAFSIE